MTIPFRTLAELRARRDTLRMLIIPDVHAPYHDHAAWSCLLDVAERWRPDVAVCLGDFADFAAVSTHRKDPSRILPFKVEVRAANEALDELDRALALGGCQTKEFLQGNHEDRLTRYVESNAPALEGFTKRWDRALKLARRGWRIHPYKTAIQYGHLRMSHDWTRCGVNAAREVVRDLGHSAAFGHTHRMQTHYEGHLDGTRHVGMTCGWLGDPTAIDYRHRDSVTKDSVHGFATATFLASGEFWLQAIPVVRGRCVVDGRVYRGE